MPPPTDPSPFHALTRALDAERREERARFAEAAANLSLEALQDRGHALCDLVARDVRGGVGGQRLVIFERSGEGPAVELGATQLRTGAPVQATRRKHREPDDPRGVVSQLSRRAITVAFDADAPDWLDEGHLSLVLLTDDTSAQRVRAGLERAARDDGPLRSVLLAQAPARFDRTLAPSDAALAPDLNPPQRAAVGLALSAQDVALIHGPPGTGKTTVLVEIARLAVARGERVLACAASNAAVDLLAGRIHAQGIRVVRLGNPARVDPALAALTLDAQIEAHDRYRVGRALVREAMQRQAHARKLVARGRAADRFAEARAERQEAARLFREARTHEAIAQRDVLERAQVIAATVTGLDGRALGDARFDRVIMDEATQATEPLAWLAALRAERLILAGDPHQLPPTVISPEASALGLGVSMFERLMGLHGGALRQMLTVQYRMHHAIAAFPSERFYGGLLTPDPAVRDHLLRDLPGVRDEPRTGSPLCFVDTAGTGFEEETPPHGGSACNPGEARLVCQEVQALRDAGASLSQLAVISPYAGQVRLLRALLPFDDLEIDTVDAFQGREKEAVLVSLVRSNTDGELGFLGDVRRMNVAMTRARRRLWMVGDSATLARHPFYAALLDAVTARGGYVSAWELGAIE